MEENRDKNPKFHPQETTVVYSPCLSCSFEIKNMATSCLELEKNTVEMVEYIDGSCAVYHISLNSRGSQMNR